MIFVSAEPRTIITDSYSDTVGITLTFAFYHLASSRQYQSMLRDELLSVQSFSDVQLLLKLPILQSIITETLRLHPPVPTGAPRDTGPQGLTLEGQFIPPFTTVVVPRYTVARRKLFKETFLAISITFTRHTNRGGLIVERAFMRPEEFLPERWTSRPEMVKDKRAFAPFSQGESRG